MKRFALNEIAIKAIAGFTTGDTVTIAVRNVATGLQEALDDASCTEWGTSGYFEWDFQNLTNFPTEYGHYHWEMDNGVGTKKTDEVIIGGYINEIQRTYLMVPFDVDIEDQPINKGDAWEPKFQIYGNAQGLKVKVELSDITTTIEKANSEVDGGDDTQVKLVAMGDTFQIYRVYATGDETATFDSNFLDVKITVETQDGKVQTTTKKIPFTQSPAISWDTV